MLTVESKRLGRALPLREFYRAVPCPRCGAEAGDACLKMVYMLAGDTWRVATPVENVIHEHSSRQSAASAFHRRARR